MPHSVPRTSAARTKAAGLPGRRTLAVASLFALALACLASGLAPFARVSAGSGAAVKVPSGPAAEASKAGATLTSEGYGRLPLRFEPNVGQAEPGVDFISRGDGYGLFLKGSEAVLALRRAVGVRGESRRTSVLRMRLVGANAAREGVGVGELPGKVNYMRGSDPAAWRTGVASFSGVEYRGVYEGIDLVYYGNQRQLEYDFRLAPGADARRIRLAFEGQTSLRVDASGDIVLRAAGGGEVRQHKPYAYQEGVDGRRVEVASRYVLKGRGRVGFEVGAYDPARPLVIDPVLAYSTYLGGGGSNDTAHGVAVDAAGNAYVTGETISTDFPTTAGAAQTAFGGPNYDAYVTKINAAGTAVVYSTYLGGGDTDEGYGIAVDADGNAYVAGRTISTNFPVTAGAFQPAYGGGTYAGGLGGDAFVSKLNPAGTALVYSTYLGGGATEYGYGIALDAARNAYVTGSTASDNFPVLNALQPAKRGDRDAFVTKLDAAGGALVYSTYFGGATTFDSLNASGLDNAFDIVVDAVGRAHVIGETQTTDFPVTANAFQRSFGGLGAYEGDAYVAKFSAAGDALVYSTYLGGSHGDSGKDIALDASGHAYVTGRTASVNFPVANAFQPALANKEAIHDAFVTKLSLDGSALVYSTYLGGDASESAQGIAVGAGGSAYVTGATNSDFFPVRNAVQGGLSGQSTDAFVTKLSPQGSALVYSTYLGGTRNETGYAVALDGAGDAYVVGGTSSLGFPTTDGALRRTRNGQADAFVSKIRVGDDEPTYRISGRVTGGDGSPLAGVDVNVFGGARARTKTSVDGTYNFEGLRAGVDYSLTAYSPCVTFATQNDTVNNLSSDQTVDFTGSVTTFSVGGRVTISNKPDEGYVGVTMKLTGAQGELTTRTDGQGNYSFPSVAGCRDYTLTASANNISFDPPSRTLTYLSQNQGFADFSGTAQPAPAVSLTSPAMNAVYEVPATVRVAAAAQATTGRGITKVEFYLADWMGTNLKPLQTDTTAPYGGFDLTNLTAGEYSVYAYAYDDAGNVGMTEPTYFSVKAPPATYGITGRVADAGGAAIGGVTVALGGASGAQTTTGADGRYSFESLAAGEGYSVVAYKDQYTFQPGSHTFENLSAPQTADFTGTPQTATQPTNFALAANGGRATASSTTTQAELPGLDFSPAGVIDGDRKGLNWEHGGGWRDATNNAFPDWVQVDFGGAKSISEVGVFMLQDNYGTPVEPTEQTTFTKFGATAFDVQYWDGSQWAAVPGASVVGNDKVWRRLTFEPVTTTRLRVVVRNALAGRSRLVEVEAWGTAAEVTPPPAGARINAALSSNGGYATASSTTTQAELPGMDFHPSSVINGDRKGLNWEHGGGWRDATNNTFPDWL
ncbi:MAG TPA: SBBP repeat-containing protein, partial [Pyrinomonadaceae bacterium]